MRKTIGIAGAAACLAAGLAVSLPAGAAPQALVPALERDLGLTTAQVHELLSREDAARALVPAVSEAAGTAFGGAWLDRGTLRVGVTDPALVNEVTAAGGTAAIVEHSADALNAVKSALDAKAETAPEEITGWYVDVPSNTVVVKTLSDTQAVQSFVDGLTPVRVTVVESRPRLYTDVIGGDAYYINESGRCSVGFAVEGGFVTAGHCGEPGATITGVDKTEMGVVEDSSFPDNDYAWVSVVDSWTPSPVVNGYGHGDVTVTGSEAAAVGASICRSGSTTGWQCGTVEALDETVQYAEGTVSGLTRTDACAEPGDSGGSWVSGTQGQGVTSGGSGDCASGGTTFFQPLGEILETYGLTLVTG
ncbi:S1 family peptidase [Actinokineospora fastidiosa]|uniref:Serine protease n=1 Tax=Actinokineospora fastidiosa TaxID=1816 RepID=A0A918LAZ1_9PSEU|nr:S1 family peptidase [Actinokineospora fastidiosa]GGS26546.1 serine protease [Actinokineospora fastidiosa]